MPDIKYDFETMKDKDFDKLAKEIESKLEKMGQSLRSPTKITVDKEPKRVGGVLTKNVEFEYGGGQFPVVFQIAAAGNIQSITVGNVKLPIAMSELKDAGKIAMKVSVALDDAIAKHGAKIRKGLAKQGGGASTAESEEADIAKMKKAKVVLAGGAGVLIQSQIDAGQTLKDQLTATIEGKRKMLETLRTENEAALAQAKDLDRQIRVESGVRADLKAELKALKSSAIPAAGVKESVGTAVKAVITNPKVKQFFAGVLNFAGVMVAKRIGDRIARYILGWMNDFAGKHIKDAQFKAERLDKKTIADFIAHVQLSGAVDALEKEVRDAAEKLRGFGEYEKEEAIRKAFGDAGARFERTKEIKEFLDDPENPFLKKTTKFGSEFTQMPSDSDLEKYRKWKKIKKSKSEVFESDDGIYDESDNSEAEESLDDAVMESLYAISRTGRR